ncbi:type II secretion system F family protein [Endozoicomonas sp.]|uniref:type II secretion system F family protein n=1 Tax=Endozoicomonas sp. TaxID=1892382 RepID=UPI002884DDCE|nr:type II secretion system F family protein [Endozoicomonas sp.]
MNDSYKHKDVEQGMIRAGIYNRRLAVIYFPAKMVIAILIFAAVFLFGERLGLTDQTQQIAAAFAGMVVVILLPDMWLHHRQKKRIRKVSAELPYVCDLMAVCVQTGMTIEASVSYLGDELKSFDKDLAFVMKRVDSVSRIAGMQRALDELVEQFPTNQVRSFSYTLSQSLQYGSSIFDVLTRLSANLREVEMLELEEKVGKLSAKMSVPLILFIMFPIVILITAPGIMRMMSNG